MAAENGDAGSSVGTGPETNHDRFRGTMLANDFLERSEKMERKFGDRSANQSRSKFLLR